MIKCIWIVLTALFFLLSLFHFYRATKAYSKAPDMAGVAIGKINGVTTGIREFIDSFNCYIDKLNRDTKIANNVTGIGYLIAAATALLSYFLSS
jgi:hypothetical protein